MADTKNIAARPASVRSRVSNGRRAFIAGDGRSMWARRFRDLTELHVADLGGLDQLSEAQLGLCKRIATIETECERLEGRLSEGESIDFDSYGKLAGTLKRLCDTVGIQRRAKDVTPSLTDYLAKKSPLTIEGDP